MKKLAALNSFAAWLMLTVALILFSAPAEAYVYDDFNGTGIDSTLWVDSIPDPDLFTQLGDGNLNFSAGAGQTDGLNSTSRMDMPFFVSMQYANFQTNNTATGDWTGSGPVLWIGYSTNSVRVYYYQNGNGSGFRAIKIVGDTKAGLGDIIPASTNNARLGIRYDGTYASLWYDVGSGWQEIPLYAPYAPSFTNDPYFGMVGYNAFGASMSFKVEQVEVNPVPLPTGLWLLGSGLLGLCGWRRFRKG